MSRSSAAATSLSTGTSGQTWALIEARSGDGAQVSPQSRVAGLSLIARQVRLAARQGWRGAVIRVADSDERQQLEAAIAKQPPAADFEIEFTVADAHPQVARSYVHMSACAIYQAEELSGAASAGRKPDPLMTLSNKDDLRVAEKRLARLIRKDLDQDGVVSYFVFRPMSRIMTRALLDSPVSPNHVSILAMLFGIAAGIFAVVAEPWALAAAGVCFWLGAVVDHVDGELARLRLQGSKLGEWLDTLADDVSTYGLLAGLGVGLLLSGADPVWAVVGIGGAVVGFLLQAKLYADLHRWGMTIDTAQYPWFFGAPAEGSSQERSVGGWIFYGVAFLFRRDAFVTMLSVALVLGYPRTSVIGLLVGVAVVFVLFVVHGVVMARRSIRGGEELPVAWDPGYFGVKDLFTIINLLGGVGGIYFAFRGELAFAGYSIFAGYVFGDALDGPVARWTNSSNRFGGEFDSAADHIGQGIAPAVIAYAAFHQGGYDLLGTAVMAALILSASLRQARFNVADFNYPLTYCGLPRTVSGLVTISLANSVLFFHNSFLGYPGLAAVLFAVALLNLSPVPYMTHKGTRKMQTYVKVLALSFFAVPAVLVVVAPHFVFDLIFICTFGYCLTGWIPLRPSERREYWTEYKRWKRQLAVK